MDMWCNAHLELSASVTHATLTGSRYVTADSAPRLSKWRAVRRRWGSGTDRESLSRSGYIIVPVTDRVSRATTQQSGSFRCLPTLATLFLSPRHTAHQINTKRHFIVSLSFLNHVASSRWLWLLFFCNECYSDWQALHTFQLFMHLSEWKQLPVWKLGKLTNLNKVQKEDCVANKILCYSKPNGCKPRKHMQMKHLNMVHWPCCHAASCILLLVLYVCFPCVCTSVYFIAIICFYSYLFLSCNLHSCFGCLQHCKFPPVELIKQYRVARYFIASYRIVNKNVAKREVVQTCRWRSEWISSMELME